MHAIYMIDFLKKKCTKGCKYAHEKHRNLSEVEKDKKHQYAWEQYKNLSLKLLTFLWKHSKLFLFKKFASFEQA